MGFNVSIVGLDRTSPCDEFINRSFYWFTSGYDTYREQSLLGQTQQVFGLRLDFLGDYQYTEDEYGLSPEDMARAGIGPDFPISWTNTKEALSQVNELIDGIHRQPTFYEPFTYEPEEGFSQPDFERYVSSGELLTDLGKVQTILVCYEQAGVEQIYCTAM